MGCFLKQRKLDMLSPRNGTGIKELPALWVGGGMGHPVLNEAAVPMTVSVQRVKDPGKRWEGSPPRRTGPWAHSIASVRVRPATC